MHENERKFGLGCRRADRRVEMIVDFVEPGKGDAKGNTVFVERQRSIAAIVQAADHRRPVLPKWFRVDLPLAIVPDESFVG